MRAPAPDDPVVTGTGMITPLGASVEATWQALVDGANGIALLADADATSGYGWAARPEPPLLRAEIPRELESTIKFLNPSGEMAVTAAAEAVRAAGWEPADFEPEAKGLYLAQLDSQGYGLPELRIGVVTASANGTKPLEMTALNKASARRVKPFFLLENLKNNAFAFVSSWFDLRGPNTGLSATAGSGQQALVLAARAVSTGRLEAAIVIGTAMSSAPVARFELARLHLAAQQREDGSSSYRPFDEHTAGVVLGDGAAAIVIESRAAATRRGAPILGTLAGFGETTGPVSKTTFAPDAETVAAAIRAALAESGCEAGDLAAALLPGGLGARDDRWQLDALAADPRTATVPAVCWRGATGNMTLASEVAEVALGLHGLQEGRLPGTPGLEARLSGIAKERLPSGAIACDAPAFLSIAAGIMGQAGALVVARA